MMPITAEAQGREFTFPDGTTQEQMGSAIDEFFSQNQSQQAGPQQPANVPSQVRPSLQQIESQLIPTPFEMVDRANQVIAENVNPAALEFAAGVNRGVINILDFLGPDQINAALELAGSERRVPTLSGSQFGQAASGGGFMQEGLARDVVGSAGEVVPGALGAGAAFRQAASKLPQFTAQSEGIVPGFVREVAKTQPGQDIALAGLSGAGGKIGGESGGDVGQLVGAVLAPTSVVVSKSALTGILNAGPQGVRTLLNSLRGMSDEGASTLLAEAMVREGISPDDVLQRMAQLGPEAIPADAGETFARLLRSASNKIPRIQGEARRVLGARQAGQEGRVFSAVEDATGTSRLSLDDEIARRREINKPEIDRLYQAARDSKIIESPKIRALFSGDNSVAKARVAADSRLKDKEALGEQISQIDIIDATKQELDDRIGKALRQGENNTVRNLVRLKNALVGEVDNLVPEYKQARDLFAGQRNLENASDHGTQFFKLKLREVKDLVESLSKSEKEMFKLGAKQAIRDKIDATQITSDLERLFGKNGDVEKLKSLFDDPEAFKRFSDSLKREAQFSLTRKISQPSPTTAQQLMDQVSAESALRDARESISSPIGAVNVVARIVTGLSKNRSEEAFSKALEEAGDILLTKGMDPEKIREILKRGSKSQIEGVLKRSLKDELKSPRLAPISGVIAEQIENR